MATSTYAHADEVDGAVRAAAAIIPAILEITGPLGSVADLGGGTGAWLAEFLRQGVERIHLYDHPSAASGLLIGSSDFTPVNLSVAMPSLPRVELAVCVECAEHLPPSRAESLVDCLTAAADLVAFSAAIPGQAGKGHVNCRPHAYWKGLFRSRGFACHDVLRQPILFDRDVPWWYQQNLFLFARPGRLESVPPDFLPPDFTLTHRHCAGKLGLRELARLIPAALAAALMGSRSRRSRTRDGC